MQANLSNKNFSSLLNKRTFLLSSILSITLLAFLPVLFNGFVNWDDTEYIKDNILIRNISFQNLLAIFSTYVMGNYHPLTILSYALEYQIGGLNPAVYHFTNVLFHILNTYLVFRFIFLLSNESTVAAIVALLFGIHPMHTESVAWVSERKDVLYAFFYLLACIFYLLHIFRENGKNKFYLFSLLMFLFSLLSKAMAITLPMVLLLIDFYSGRKISKQSIWGKIPFFLLSIIFGLVAIAAQQSEQAIQSITMFPVFDRILFACYEIVIYLWKIVLPIKLSIYYPYPVKTGNMLPVFFYLAPVIILLVIFTLYYFRKNKNVLFGCLFFFFQIGLVLQFVPLGGTIISERFTYLAYIGLFFIAGKTFFHFHEKQKFKIPLTITGCIIVIIFFLMTWQRCRVWKDDFTLWSDSNSKYQSEVGLNHLGNYYENIGDYESAEQYYNQAILLYPFYATSFENRGKIYFYKQKYNLSSVDFNKALEINPNSEIALTHKGVAFGYLKQYDSAIFYFSKAIMVKNNFWEAYKYRGNSYTKIGNYDLALSDFDTYLRIFDKEAEAYYLRGLAQLGLGKFYEAITDFSQSIKLNPKYSEVYFARSTVYVTIDKLKEAKQDAMTAKSLGYEVDKQYLESFNNNSLPLKINFFSKPAK